MRSVKTEYQLETNKMTLIENFWLLEVNQKFAFEPKLF